MSTTHVLPCRWQDVLEQFDEATRQRHTKLARALVDAGFLREDAARRSVEWIVLRQVEAAADPHGVPPLGAVAAELG